MQLSFLPHMTVELAQALTGIEDAGRLLDQLYRRQMFTDRRRVASQQARHVYQFHALFRTFLQHRARAAWKAQELRELARRAGRLLEAAGHGEEALVLLAEGADWACYAQVIRACADAAIGHGRQRTVENWLEAMPDAERDRDPWLGFWQGRSLVDSAPERALTVLQASHRRFQQTGDVAGQLACGAAAVQTLWFARLGWSEIMPWVDRLEPLLRERVTFPTPAIELMSYSALHAALAFCRLDHPAIQPLARRLLALVDDAGLDWTQRLTTATHLMTFFHSAGQDDLAQQLMGKVDGAVETRPASALSRAFWHVFRAVHDMRNARDEEASRRFQQAEDLARAEGLQHAEFAAMQFRTYLDNVFRRLDDAQARLARMERHPARVHHDAEMNYWMAQTLVAQSRGDPAAAFGHAQRTLKAVEQVGAAYFRAIFRPLVASAFADVGQFDEAMELVASTRRLVQGTYLEVMETQLLLEEAYVAHLRGDAQAARARIAQALPLAVAGSGHAAYAQRILSRNRALLEIALEAGIEPEFVRRTIRMWRLAPPAEEIAAWPWAVRVRTLGGFDVQVNDAPVEFGRKAPRKTLALLKAVIARGGSAPESGLIDTFWPDEPGDTAARSLAAAVHRLRGLLGHADAVIQQGGQVTLDRARVWVDAWAFERVLPDARAAHDDDAAAQALAFYRGAFLAEEEGDAWPVAMRERLRSKFIQAVAAHASRLESQRRHEEAIGWYLRGLDADNVVEPFYQGLMRCYHSLDRMPEAVSAYRRLKQTLSVTLSLPPSAATEKLYQTLRLGSANP
jgi:DNA-binding SARP family transcriptional activator